MTQLSDLDALAIFEEPFLDDHGVPRDERLALRNGLVVKQVYARWNKKRFAKWIQFGTSLRSGWLTEEGKAQLAKLRKAQ